MMIDKDYTNVKPTASSLLLTLITAICLEMPSHAQPPPTQAGGPTAPFTTPLTADNIDPAAYGQWVDGAESPMPESKELHRLLWTQNNNPDWMGVAYGPSKNAGVRHLRIGFKTPVPAGTIFLRGVDQVSVLKPGAAYPGNLNDPSQWVLAYRIKDNAITRDEPGPEDYTAWVLPERTSTRALRFTHTSAPTDVSYAGHLGAALVLADRMVNLAPQAHATTSSNTDKASLLNDSSNNGTWNAWDNRTEGAEHPISAAHPEWMMLTWPKTVALRGLAAFWTGFGAADVQTYTGASGSDPAAAPDANWQTIKTYESLVNGYFQPLFPNWLDFGAVITTHAVRLRITAPTQESHPHLVGKTADTGATRGGRRIWLGELMALQPIGDADLRTTLLPQAPAAGRAPHPPIPIHFTLPAAGYVTLVIEGMDGKRIRNLVSETPFPAGQNTAWWDGTDDLGRDTEAAHHGLYHVPGAFAPPGSYLVRGLFHKEIDLRYEFSVYNAGSPAWDTQDGTGGWLTNHTPPSSALFVPAARAPGGKPLVYLGSFVSEGGSGLAWVDPSGRKVGGRGNVGGAWAAAPYLAYDSGDKPAGDAYAYVGSAWDGELRLTALTPGGDKAVLTPNFKLLASSFTPAKPLGLNWGLSGLAVHNGLLAASLSNQNQLLFVDVAGSKVLGTAALEDPRGLAFDSQGRLLALVGNHLLRYTLAADPTQLPTPQTLVTDLEDPQGITLDGQGSIYISDRGMSHQVKVYDTTGKLIHIIGAAGLPKAGPYDPNHMNNPRGLAVDANNHLWVAEEDYQPKRVSEWDAQTGKLLNAFYGPSQYGGGGTLDSQDKTRFYYTGMEFKLDWKTGENHPVDVFFRPGPNDLQLPDGYGASGDPETPLYSHGRKYMTNCFDSSPTNGAPIAMLWLMKNGIAVPVAAMGSADSWSLLKGDAFKGRWPAGVDLNGNGPANKAWFLWSDTNSDGHVQPEEVTFGKGSSGGVTVMPDISFVASYINDATVRFPPQGYTPGGAPVYSAANTQTLMGGAQGANSSGGNQALADRNGWLVSYPPPLPYSTFSLGGGKNGVALWSYPNMWPGLHPSHESARPDHPGEVIGATRLLGGFVTPKGGDAGPLWAINGNMGNMYLFTADGLFVTQLFQDVRGAKLWSMPVAQRNMKVNEVSLHDENFWPTITQTSDGLVYLNSSTPNIVRVDGLDSIKRIPARTFKITTDDLKSAQAYAAEAEAERQKSMGSGILKVAMTAAAPTVDGKLDDWSGADWVTVDRSGTDANFNSNSRAYYVTAALRIAGDRLYAAYKTGEANLLNNAGGLPNAPFKTGGALDLMLNSIPGGERLLVTQIKGKTTAILYRPHVPGTTTEPVPFSSPWRTIKFDRVDDVSDQVILAGDGQGSYEFSVPLSLLNLKPEAGGTIKGDIGVLRGDGSQTLQRVYWNNKATAITADVPSEAELTPQLWGTLQFTPAP